MSCYVQGGTPVSSILWGYFKGYLRYL